MSVNQFIQHLRQNIDEFEHSNQASPPAPEPPQSSFHRPTHPTAPTSTPRFMSEPPHSSLRRPAHPTASTSTSRFMSEPPHSSLRRPAHPTASTSTSRFVSESPHASSSWPAHPTASTSTSRFMSESPHASSRRPAHPTASTSASRPISEVPHTFPHSSSHRAAPISAAARTVGQVVDDLYKPYGSKNYRAKKRKAPSVGNPSFKLGYVVLLPCYKKRTRLGKGVYRKYAKRHLTSEQVPFSRLFTAEQVQDAFVQLFPTHLQGIPFDILKDEGGDLIKPPLPANNSTLDGENIKNIFRQKKVYLRPTFANLSTVTLIPEDEINDGKLSSDEESDKENVDELENSVSSNAFLDSNFLQDHQYAAPIQVPDSPSSDCITSSPCKRSPSPAFSSSPLSAPASDWVADSANDSASISTMLSTSDTIAHSIGEKTSETNSFPASEVSPLTMDEALAFLAAEVKDENQKKIIVSRRSVLKSAYIGFSRKYFSITKKLCVQFASHMAHQENGVTKENMYEEEGFDAGGPTNEFFTLALKEMHKCSIFEGPDDARFLSFDSVALQKNHYLYIGQIIALSLAYGGPGLSFLSEEFYDCILQRSLSKRSLAIDFIYDLELKMEFEKFSAVTKVEDLQNLLSSSLLATIAGIANRRAKDIAAKEEILQGILKFLLIDRLHEPFQQFLQGLNSLNCLDILSANPKGFSKFFLANASSLHADDVKNMFKEERSEEGSVAYLLEDEVLRDWQIFLNDVEEEEHDITLEEVVYFATGLDREPPFGWHTKPRLRFLHDKKDPGTLPEASTCAASLYLPVHYVEFEVFSEKMAYAIKFCKTMSKT